MNKYMHKLRRNAKNIPRYSVECRFDADVNGLAVPVYVCRDVRNTNILPGTCRDCCGKRKGCSRKDVSVIKSKATRQKGHFSYFLL